MSIANTEKIRLEIKLVGNDHPSTQKAAQEVSTFFKNNNCKILAIVKQPVRQRFIYSIRKCHFIYKESRDQFTSKTHKIVIFVSFDSDKQNDLREKMKKVHIPAGVSVSMKMKENKKESINSEQNNRKSLNRG